MALSLILSFQRVSKWKNTNGPDTGDQGNQVLLEEDKTQKECTLLQEVDSDWRPEMEFLDINLTKDSSLLFHAILKSALKENHTLLWF
jgi:hypothetical protein